MGKMAGPGFDLALAGLSYFSAKDKAAGEAASYEFKSSEAKRQAAAARTAADQTSAYFTDELNRTVGNIDAVHASTGVDPTSPTSLALIGKATEVIGTQRDIRVGNLLNKAAVEDRAGEFYQWNAKNALDTGDMNAWMALLNNARGAASSLPDGKVDISDTPFNPVAGLTG